MRITYEDDAGTILPYSEWDLMDDEELKRKEELENDRAMEAYYDTYE